MNRIQNVTLRIVCNRVKTVAKRKKNISEYVLNISKKYFRKHRCVEFTFCRRTRSFCLNAQNFGHNWMKGQGFRSRKTVCDFCILLAQWLTLWSSHFATWVRYPVLACEIVCGQQVGQVRFFRPGHSGCLHRKSQKRLVGFFLSCYNLNFSLCKMEKFNQQKSKDGNIKCNIQIWNTDKYSTTTISYLYSTKCIFIL